MKLSKLLQLAVFQVWSLLKNIFDLESLKQGLQNEETVNNDKREPVNLLYLDRFKMGVSDEEKAMQNLKEIQRTLLIQLA